jgi:CheY-like chemotaxis protein
MDLQMPVMDGYQATAKLRSDTRFATLPIIAMTAHATLEERQRCLSAGMNDHVAKPIDPGLLFDTVGRFYRARPPASASPPPAETGAPKAPSGDVVPATRELPGIEGLDHADGLTRVAGNRKLYGKLLRQFVEQQGGSVAHIKTATGQGDFALAERLAHTLKGVAGNIGAKAVQAAAGALEKLLRERKPAAELEQACQGVSTVLDALVARLEAALQGTEPAAAPPAEGAGTTDPARMRDAAGQLTKLLSEFDPGSVEFIEAHQAALRGLFSAESWSAFEALVQGYSFAEAQAQLEAALQSLPPA